MSWDEFVVAMKTLEEHEAELQAQEEEARREAAEAEAAEAAEGEEEGEAALEPAADA